jgi:hypothetical protein
MQVEKQANYEEMAERSLACRGLPCAVIAGKRQQKTRRFRAGPTISVCTFDTISIRIGQAKGAFAHAVMRSKSPATRSFPLLAL